MPDWRPEYTPRPRGGWYVTNVCYPYGAVGCVSDRYPDGRWRIVCDLRPDPPSYATRDDAARAERALTTDHLYLARLDARYGG